DQFLFGVKKDGKAEFIRQPDFWDIRTSVVLRDQDLVVRIIEQDNAAKLADSQRQMRALFIEGGAMVTGRFIADDPSTTYAIVNDSILENISTIDYCQNITLEQLKADLTQKKSCQSPLTREDIIEIAAADLGIKKDLLVIVDDIGGRHLDTEVFTLPGGKILVNDHNLLVKILADNNLLPERYNIDNTYKAHTFLKDKITDALQKFNEKGEKYKFNIIPAPGASDILNIQCDSIPDCADREIKVNFFNGVNLKAPSGQRIVITNKARLVTHYIKSVPPETEHSSSISIIERIRKRIRPANTKISVTEERLPLEAYWANLLA
ncbi:MAG: hypothetical protein LBG46_07490, partial [Elusimicrobiota bacterium]|nr:hypothetical protein [Elusimicrobiota bacterium]